MATWEKQPRETARAYFHFSVYLELGPDRTLRKVLAEVKKPDRYLSNLKQWSARWKWVTRAAAFDQHEIRERMKRRTMVRELAIQILVENAQGASHTIVGLMAGDVPTGSTEAVLDRHGDPALDADGEQIRRLLVAPSTRLEAAKRIHESIGIVPPKRVELSGPDGDAIRMAQEAAEGLDDDTLAQLRKLANQVPDGNA